MLGLNLFALAARLLTGRMQSRHDETQLRRELLAHQRRQLIHHRIPDAHTVQVSFGSQFDELRELLVLHDPGRLGQDATNSPLYEELARTIIYQLPSAGETTTVPSLVQQEVSLWFGAPAAAAAQLAPLSEAVVNWQLTRGSATTPPGSAYSS